MDHYSHNLGAWWPDRDLVAYEDTEQDATRNSTSTFDTVYSGYSENLTSISGDSARISRAPSLASSCTSYSSSSLPSTHSWISTLSGDFPAGQGSLPGRLLFRQTHKDKQATNPYACSHCNLTFSKKGDRKKHVLQTCPYFGSEFVCAQCTHISRNKYQADKHQKESGHEGTCEAVTVFKHALTCSNDGKIYRSLEEYLDHFSSSKCILNSFEGDRKHPSRLRTLLSEGRCQDAFHGHSYIYAALVSYCSKYELTSEACNAIIDALPSSTAQNFAERLEWGCVPNDNSGRSRLGYTNFDTMVAEIMTAGAQEARRHHSRHHAISHEAGQTSTMVPYTQQLLERHISSRPGSHGSLSTTAATSSVCIRRKQIPINPINTSRPLPPLPRLGERSEVARDIATKSYRESPAVTIATAMLRQQCLHTQKLEDSTKDSRAGRKANREKRPRPAGSPGQPESPPHSKMDLRPSPTHKISQEYGAQNLDCTGTCEPQEDRSDQGDYPEIYSLTPPLTARNVASAVRSQSPQQHTADDVKQKRQAGVWKSLIDEFITFSDDEDES